MIVPALREEHLQAPGTHSYVTESGTGHGVQGFSLRCYPSGKKTYVLRFAGQVVTIGDPQLLTLDEARRRARRKKIELIEGPDPKRAAREVTLAELWEEKLLPRLGAMVKADRLRAGTAQQYRRTWVAILLPRFGRLRLGQITTGLLEEWKLAETDRPVMFNRALQQLQAGLSYAVKVGWLVSSPAGDVQPYGEHPSGRHLSDDEIRRWAAALRELGATGKVSAAEEAGLWTLFYTGCRPGEILGARKEWLEVDGGEVGRLHLPKAKGDRSGRVRGRTVRVPAPALQRLLFLSPEGEPELIPGVTSLRRAFDAVCRHAGIEGATPKVLRHVWRSVGPEAGVDKEHLRQLGGWASHRVPDRVYSHERPALDNAAARIAERLEEISNG